MILKSVQTYGIYHLDRTSGVSGWALVLHLPRAHSWQPACEYSMMCLAIGYGSGVSESQVRAKWETSESQVRANCVASEHQQQPPCDNNMPGDQNKTHT